MPGWHIFADLTPPELIVSRRARKVRFAVLATLVVLVAASAGGTLWARSQADLAAADVVAERSMTDVLRTQQRNFTEVTSLQGTIGGIERQVAELMASGVDFDTLLGDIWQALPDGMTIDSIGITVPSHATGAPPAAREGGAGELDTSEEAHIGTASLSGTGQQLTDLALFIDELSAIPGIFSPYPLQNNAADEGTVYSLQLTLTDVLFTHRFAVEGAGS